MSATTSTPAVPEEIEYLVVPQGTPQGDQITPSRTIKAFFDAPSGECVMVTLRLFCVGDVFGVGIYPEPDSGTVLRWHDGPHAKPRVIHWQAPHCEDDQCGSPCAHPNTR
jgi:hypothetical protein